MALIDEPPTAPLPGGGADHELTEYDLGGWSHVQRTGLDMLLVGADIPHTWDSTLLAVPRARSSEVDSLLDTVETEWAGDAPA